MTYAVVSSSTTTEPMNAEMQALAQRKYVPAIKALGALHVFFIAAGEQSFKVATICADQEAVSGSG